MADRDVIGGKIPDGSGGGKEEDAEFVDWQKMKAYLEDKEAKGEKLPGQGGKDGDEPMSPEEVQKMLDDVKMFSGGGEEGREHDEL